VRLVLVPAVLDRATVTAEGGDNPVAVEVAFDALPPEDGFANCGVDVSAAKLASLADVRHEVLDFHWFVLLRFLLTLINLADATRDVNTFFQLFLHPS